MAWGSKTSATQLTSISNTEQFFDQTPTLNPGESAHVQIKFDPVGSPSDDLEVNVYTTLDDSTETWDHIPMLSLVMDKDEVNGSGENVVSFTVSGVYKFRIGVAATGGTDSHTSADMSYRKDGLNL